MTQDFSINKIDSAKKIHFLSDANESKNTLSVPKQGENDKKLSNSAKYMIGATALATAVVACIAIAHSIKKGKVQELAEPHVKKLSEKIERGAARKAQEAAESESLKIQEHVAAIKECLHKKPVINAEILDARFKPKPKVGSWSKEDMKAYYESDCAIIKNSKLYTSEQYFSADNRLFLEKRRYTALSDYGEGATEVIKIDKKGKKVSEIKAPDGKIIESKMYSPNENYIEKRYFENDKLSKIISEEKGGSTITVFNEGTKTSIHTSDDGTYVFRLYEQDKNGKYHCTRRKTIKNTDKSDSITYSTKIVEYINDGEYSKTTFHEVCKPKYEQEVPIKEERKTFTIRDKKGNIIAESEIVTTESKKSGASGRASGTDGEEGADGQLILASWYKAYLKLCQEFGVAPRECGAGGAGEHYFELCLRKSDSRAYMRYLELQEERAEYDENAMLLGILRMVNEKFSSEELIKLSKEELKSLYEFIKRGEIEINSIKNSSAEQLREQILYCQKLYPRVLDIGVEEDLMRIEDIGVEEDLMRIEDIGVEEDLIRIEDIKDEEDLRRISRGRTVREDYQLEPLEKEREPVLYA